MNGSVVFARWHKCAPHLVHPFQHLHLTGSGPCWIALSIWNARCVQACPGLARFCPQNCLFTCKDPDPHLTHGSLSPPKFTLQSVQPFLHSLRLWQTDHTTLVCRKRPHLASAAMWPDNTELSLLFLWLKLCSFLSRQKIDYQTHFELCLCLWSRVICTVARCYIMQGVGPQEYTLIKMKLKEPYPAKLQYVHCLCVTSQSVLDISYAAYEILHTWFYVSTVLTMTCVHLSITGRYCIKMAEQSELIFWHRGYSWLIMAAMRSRCGHYIFALWFLSPIFFSLFLA